MNTMATNLIAEIMSEFRGETLNTVASAIGETPDRTRTALGGVLPALIGGLAGGTSTSDQAGKLLNVIKGNGLDTGPFTDMSSAVRSPGGINNLISMGRPLLDSLFGGRVGGITEWVSSLSGISRSSSSSLLGLALPLVLGQIGKRVQNLGGNASNLMSLLGDQRQFLQDAPRGLAGVLGEAAPRHVDTHARVDERRLAYESEPRRRAAWVWALPLLALIPLLMFFLSRRGEAPRQTVVDTTRPAARGDVAAPDVPRVIPPGTAAGLGAFVERRLPNDVTLRIPAGGVEGKLVEHIEDRTQVPGTETWFSFDRVEFETDSATLRPSASEQLQNIADIMKAYPNVKVKIGGYTDNTAERSYNVKLSQGRANAAMNQIASFGVDRSRLTAEGFGDAHPIADNSTPEGRQRNRRVDISVTEK
jgi:outer membrane protein OmpA-like peptidoglycan-associated protein